MPVEFGQEEAVQRVERPLNAEVAQPDQHLETAVFDQREAPKQSLDLRMRQDPLPFHTELDQFYPEGLATAINGVLPGQNPQDALCSIRGTGGQASYPRIGFDTVVQEQMIASTSGFKTPYAYSMSGLKEAEPEDKPVARLNDGHIVSVLAEERAGFRRPDAENGRIIAKPIPAGGSRLAGRRFGMARQQNPFHLKKPRNSVPVSFPAKDGIDRGIVRINDGLLPDQRRLPDTR